jgi:hypothetical protein
MDPSVPPLNARNPAIRIMPPRPVSCRTTRQNRLKNAKTREGTKIFLSVFFFCHGIRLCLYWTASANGPLVHSQLTCEWMWCSGGMILTGENQRTRTENCRTATSSYTDSPSSNSGLSGEKATNRLSYLYICAPAQWSTMILSFQLQLLCSWCKISGLGRVDWWQFPFRQTFPLPSSRWVCIVIKAGQLSALEAD